MKLGHLTLAKNCATSIYIDVKIVNHKVGADLALLSAKS